MSNSTPPTDEPTGTGKSDGLDPISVDRAPPVALQLEATRDGGIDEVTAAPTDVAKTMPYMAGDVIANKYRLTKILGEDGMGAVWLARHLVFEIDVAVKLIRRDSVNAEGTMRLFQEARAAVRIGHPCIVRVLDFGTTEHADPFFVMEVLQGESLGQTIKRKGKLSAISAVRTLLPVAGAIAAAHCKGIVHRDLKLDNIRLVTDDRGAVIPKVVDFGIAKLRHDNIPRETTQAGVILGSPHYMSPEQACGRSDVGHRTDIWSFSVMLYEVITGKRPFEGPNYNALISSILVFHPAPLSEHNLDEPALWALVNKGLAKEPDDRWQSMQDYGEALAAWAAKRDVETDAAGNSLRGHWRVSAVHRPPVEIPPPLPREFLEPKNNERDAPASPTGLGQDYGLVIGVNDYPKLRPLQGAIADAQAFATWLLEAKGGGLAPANVRIVVSTPDPLSPVGHEINDALEDLLERANATGGRRFYFYFSGHGCVGDRANDITLCMANWSELRRRAALSSEAWLDVIVRSGAFDEVAFFLDCCRVWAVRAVGLPPHIDFVRPAERDQPTRIFMAYATELQRAALEAFAGESLEMRGIFTRELIAGLSGNAADVNGVVTANSLKCHLEKNVKWKAERYGLRQRAEVVNGLEGETRIGFAKKQPVAPLQSPGALDRADSMARFSREFMSCSLPPTLEDDSFPPRPPRPRRLPFKRVSSLPNPLTSWLPIAHMQNLGDYNVAIAAAWLDPIPAVTSLIADTVDAPSRLLVILLDPTESGPSVPLGIGWSLHGEGMAISFSRENTWHANESDSSIYSARMKPGTYTLRWGGKREFVIPLYKGFTTQVIVDHVDGTPNFASLRFFLLPGIEQPHAPPAPKDAETVEHGLALLASGEVSREDIPQLLLDRAFDEPMFGLLVAYLLGRVRAPDPKLVRAIADRIESLLGPCPDVYALRLRVALLDGSDLPKRACAEPPMLREGLFAFVEASHRVPEIIEPGSLLEHACVHRLVDSSVSSWTPQTSASATENDWLTVAIADVSVEHVSSEKSIDALALAKQLGVPTEAVNARLRKNVQESLALVRESETITSATLYGTRMASENASHEAEVEASLTAHDFKGALALIERILASDPENNDMRQVARLCREKLDVPVELVPRLMVSPSDLAAMAFDARTAETIRHIDGKCSIDEVIRRSPFFRYHGIVKLHELVVQGIIEIVRVPVPAG